MFIACPACKARYEIPMLELPSGGIRARCTGCNRLLRLSRPGELSPRAESPPEESRPEREDGGEGPAQGGYRIIRRRPARILVTPDESALPGQPSFVPEMALEADVAPRPPFRVVSFGRRFGRVTGRRGGPVAPPSEPRPPRPPPARAAPPPRGPSRAVLVFAGVGLALVAGLLALTWPAGPRRPERPGAAGSARSPARAASEPVVPEAPEPVAAADLPPLPPLSAGTAGRTAAGRESALQVRGVRLEPLAGVQAVALHGVVVNGTGVAQTDVRIEARLDRDGTQLRRRVVPCCPALEPAELRVAARDPRHPHFTSSEPGERLEPGAERSFVVLFPWLVDVPVHELVGRAEVRGGGPGVGP